MGIIKCPKHGVTGLVPVCNHIYKSIQDSCKCDGIVQLRAEISEGEYLSKFLCRECALNNDVPLSGAVSTLEEILNDNDRYEVARSQGKQAVCIECLKEAYPEIINKQ